MHVLWLSKWKIKNISPPFIAKTSLIVGIVLWTLLILFGKLKIGTYGAIYSYGITGLVSIFFILLSILIGFFDKNSIKPIYVYIGIIYLILILRFTIFLFEKIPMFPFVYRVYGHTEYITRTGHSNPNILGYQTWPGVMYLGAILEEISKIGIYIMTSVRLTILTVIVATMYLLLRLIAGNKNAISGILFAMTSMYGLYYYVPMSLALALKITAVYLLFVYILHNKQKATWLMFIIIPALIISHLLTYLAFLFTVIGLLISVKLFEYRNNVEKVLFIFVILSFMEVLFWITSHTYTMRLFRSFYSNPNLLVAFITKFLHALYSTEHTAKTTVTGITFHAEVLRIKRYYVYSVLAVSLLSFFMTFYNLIKERKNQNKIYLFILFTLGFLLSTYMVGIPAIVGAYSGEVYSRVLMFSTWIFALMIAFSLSNKKFLAVILSFLLISPYLYVLCTYGNSEYDYVAPNEITGVAYFYTTTSKSTHIHVLNEPLWEFKYIEQYRSIQLHLPQDDIRGYVAMSSRRIEGIKFFSGKELDLVPIKMKGFKIYSSGNYYTNVPSVFEIYYVR
ncbi:hypothetical protein [Thermococcus sp.]